MLFSSSDRGKHQGFMLISFITMFFIFNTSVASTNAYDAPVNHPPIPLLDEQGNNVLGTSNPYSPKKSCEGSGCHDYEAITHAYHFEMGRDEASDTYGEKRGLPHLVSPGYFGGYTCMGGSNPNVLAKKSNSSESEFADFGAAGWVKDCMNCHTGGGWTEKDRHGMRYDEKPLADIPPLDGDYYDRVINPDTGKSEVVQWDWKDSGVVEADCMICHAKFSDLKVPEGSLLEEPTRGMGRMVRSLRGDLAEEGYFREAGTAIMELVQTSEGKNMVQFERHMMESGEGGMDMGSSPMLSMTEAGKPKLRWNPDAFDSTGRVVIPMLRFPENDNCMACHRTSNSRRGFYGFGEDASATIAGEGEGASDGVLEDDYKDDVHKGKTYVDDNGEARVLDSCNACHSKQYYKPLGAAIDLDADHNFPKGDSDMDVRNDLDYAPNAKSCEECHMTSKNPIIPSKHDSMLSAHRELWKGNGDMAGYSQDSLTRITQTHFDVVSCQACHITDKKDRNGNDFQIMFRYRRAEDGKLKMVPYNPRLRYYWKDKVTGRVLTKHERNSVFKQGEDEEGEMIGLLVDPISGETLAKVSARMSHGSLRYGDPDTYEGIKALKSAYDKLLQLKGYSSPNTTMVWSESNEYIISHNTRPSPDSVQCEECHARKQSGAFSALVSPEGIMGTANSKKVTTIPDNRLVTEGIITIGLPYMKLQPNGDITENVSDILYTTKVDPFMTLLKNSSADEVIAEFTKTSTESFLNTLTPATRALSRVDFSSIDSFVFLPNKGDLTLRNMAAAIDANSINSLLFPTFRAVLGQIKDAEQTTQDFLNQRGYGQLRSNLFYLDVLNTEKKHVNDFFGSNMYVVAAYKGNKTNVNQVNVVMANWDVSIIKTIPATDILEIIPAGDLGEGYVIFRTPESGYFAVSDK